MDIRGDHHITNRMARVARVRISGCSGKHHRDKAKIRTGLELQRIAADCMEDEKHWKGGTRTATRTVGTTEEGYEA